MGLMAKFNYREQLVMQFMTIGNYCMVKSAGETLRLEIVEILVKLCCFVKGRKDLFFFLREVVHSYLCLEAADRTCIP